MHAGETPDKALSAVRSRDVNRVVEASRSCDSQVVESNLVDKLIYLTQGKVTAVDEEDFNFLGQFTWYAVRMRNSWYAKTTLSSTKDEVMHRMILRPRPEMLVDHKDGDGLNNRRSNLREATIKQNSRNRGPQQGRKYKGVYRTGKGRIFAKIQVDRKAIRLGTFESEEDAAKAYDVAASKYFGEFAYLNLKQAETHV